MRNVEVRQERKEVLSNQSIQVRISNTDPIDRLITEITMAQAGNIGGNDPVVISASTEEPRIDRKEKLRGRPKGSKTKKSTREMKVLVPEAIDIDQILSVNPYFYTKSKMKTDGHWEPYSTLAKSESLDRSKLLWVLSEIDFFETINQDEEYAPIAASYWHKNLGKGYPQYFRFLEQAHVIEVDHHYSNGYDEKTGRERESKTKGYRIADQYHVRTAEQTHSAEFPKSEMAYQKYTGITEHTSDEFPKSENAFQKYSDTAELTNEGEFPKSENAYWKFLGLAEHTITVDFPKSEKAFLKFTETDEFFKDLVFDHEGACKYVESLFRNSITVDVEGESAISRKQFRILSHMIRTIKKFENKDFRVKRDLTSYRANSVLTQMNSALRKFVFWKAKRLYSIDLRNSQPLLLSLLFQEISGYRCSQDFSITSKDSISISSFKPSITANTISNIHKEASVGGGMSYRICFSEIQNAEYASKTKFLATLMATGILPAQNSVNENITIKATERNARSNKTEKQQAEVQQFFDLCVSGWIYEYFRKAHNSKHGVHILTRDEIKHLFVIYLFSKNTAQNEVIKPVMMTHFPYLHSLVKRIKQKDHKVLSVLLQCMESHLFLDVVARRLHEHQIPFATVHDSIISTEEHIEVVKQVITGAFIMEFGITPSLKSEYWTEKASEDPDQDFEIIYTDETMEEPYEQRTPPADAPRATQIDSESVYTIKASYVRGEQRSHVIEPPTSFSGSKRNDISPETIKLMSALAEYHIEDEDLPKSSEELNARVADLEHALAEARKHGDTELITQYENMIMVMRHCRLRMNLMKFSLKR